jgi:hypothetical protein
VPVPHRRSARAVLASAAAVLSVAALAVGPVAAHAAETVGSYSLEVGWLNEPAYVGQPNAVQVTIVDTTNDTPVVDLAVNSLAVVVSTAGTDSQSLSFEPGFDATEMSGPLGQYDAAIVPTAPGDYTFHVTGSIHGTAVDITVMSGDQTFDSVITSADLEFPAKVPTLTEVGTRLDRIDSRIAALQSADPGTAALQAAQAAADAATTASASADRALLVGLLVGGAGLLVAVIALVVAARATRRGTGSR